jgi:hypothetical protein
MTLLLNVAYVEEPGDVESWLGIVHIGIILFWTVLPNWSLESRVVCSLSSISIAFVCVYLRGRFRGSLVLHMAPDGHETMALESQLGALWRYVWENSPRKKRCAAWLQKSRWFFWLFHGVSVIFCSLHRSVSHSRRVATKTAPKDCNYIRCSCPTVNLVNANKYVFRQCCKSKAWIPGQCSPKSVLRPKLASAHPTSSAKFPPTPKWSDFCPLGKNTSKPRGSCYQKGVSSPKLAELLTMLTDSCDTM